MLHALENSLDKFSRLLLFNALLFFTLKVVCMMDAFQKFIVGADIIAFVQLSQSLLGFTGL